MDYYNTLGVSKSASPEEIKRAYRKLAMKHHPDRGGDRETLQKINEAYETLKDPAKRQQYDNPQAYTNNQHGQGNDFFDQMFRNFHQHQRGYHARNRDIHITANIELRDILYGRILVFQYRLQSGKMEQAELAVPQGIEEDQMVRYPNLGDDGNQNIKRGDLIVKFKTKQDPNWQRDRQNLITTATVSSFEAILGTTIPIKTLEGKTLNLKVPAGTNPDTVLSITGYGLPVQNSNERGKLYVRIKVFTPKINNPELMKKIQAVYEEVNKS